MSNEAIETIGYFLAGVLVMLWVSKNWRVLLRDYFAAKAMQGLLASEVNAPMKVFADRAYKLADEMMKVRG